MPDNTVGTIVTPSSGQSNSQSSGQLVITGGTQQLNTLFHSFETFSPDTTNVLFQLGSHQSDINLVLSRVTGNNASLLNSQLQLTGGNRPDLFLINPNGISFGPNANLQLPGSFLASTADRLLFDGGVSFGSHEPGPVPLLTVAVPTGLQLGGSANPVANPVANPSANSITLNQTNLTVNPGESLALLGGDIALSQSLLQAEGGQLSLGSVAPGSVLGLESDSLQVNYAHATGFRDIRLSQESIGNVSGDGGGRFQVQGRNIRLIEDSALIATNNGPSDGGQVSVSASETLEMIGTLEEHNSRITADVEGSGQGNHLRIAAKTLLMDQAAQITADTYSPGTGGGLTLTADEAQLIGNLDGDGWPSKITSSTFDEGQGGSAIMTVGNFSMLHWSTVGVDARGTEPTSGSGGDLTLNVGKLELGNGAQLGNATFGGGDSGDVTITAQDSIHLTGAQPFSLGLASSGLFASSEADATGNAGQLTLVSPRLRIVDGATISASTVNAGQGGSITIRADEIEVADPINDFNDSISGLVANVVVGGSGLGGAIDIETNRLTVRDGGQISTSTEGAGNAGSIRIRANEVNVVGASNIAGASINEKLYSAITSSSTTDFKAGSVKIQANQISLREGGVLSVSNLAQGDAGNLDLSVDRLELDNGTLQAVVAAGSEGNIGVTAETALLLKNRSQITTSATGSAQGGNIALNAPLIVGYGNSDIAANAVDGRGGNILVNTQGLLGLESREQLTPKSDITASAQSGINGAVSINSLGFAPNYGLLEQPIAFVETETQVAQHCGGDRESSFQITGRGGLSFGPTQPLNAQGIWHDDRTVAQIHNTVQDDSDHITLSSPQLTDQGTEATTWRHTNQGEIELMGKTSLRLNRQTAFPRKTLGGTDECKLQRLLFQTG